MRTIGFSTGALAYADFRRGLELTLALPCEAVELSALREAELDPLLDALDGLEFGSFRYVSIHAPSAIDPANERAIVLRLLAADLMTQPARRWPIIVHPDAIRDFALWRELGPLVCIENMDKRKPIGRYARELRPLFEKLPEATFCFDIGHARQIDPTMTEAFVILREFHSRLRQVHLSEVSTDSRHSRLSYLSIRGFQEVAHWIPESVPIILETPVHPTRMAAEIEKAREALPLALAGSTANVA